MPAQASRQELYSPASGTPTWLHAIAPVGTRSPWPATAPRPLPEAFTNASLVLGLPSWAGPLVLAAVIAGLVARLAWVAAGLRRLRRLRRGAARLEPRPAPVVEAVRLAAADADVRLSRFLGAARFLALLVPRLSLVFAYSQTISRAPASKGIDGLQP